MWRNSLVRQPRPGLKEGALSLNWNVTVPADVFRVNVSIILSINSLSNLPKSHLNAAMLLPHSS